MSKAVLFFADGTEECEALLVADLLRRAKVEVIIASAISARRRGFPPEVCGLRAPDHDCKKARGEKYQRTAQDGGDRIGTLRSFLRFFQESTCNYGENVL